MCPVLDAVSLYPDCWNWLRTIGVINSSLSWGITVLIYTFYSDFHDALLSPVFGSACLCQCTFLFNTIFTRSWKFSNPKLILENLELYASTFLHRVSAVIQVTAKTVWLIKPCQLILNFIDKYDSTSSDPGAQEIHFWKIQTRTCQGNFCNHFMGFPS